MSSPSLVESPLASPLLKTNTNDGWQDLQRSSNHEMHHNSIFRGRYSTRNSHKEADDHHHPNSISELQQSRGLRRRRTCLQLCGCDPNLIRRKNTRQIIAYSVDSLIAFGFFSTKGTFLRTRFLWVQTLLVFIISSIVFVVGYETQAFDNLSTASLKQLITFMNGLCTFLLSLFISLSITRWWSIRYSCLGDLFNSVSETAMLSSSYLREGPDKIALREKLVRYGVLSFALLFEDGRGGMGSTAPLRRLVRQDMCTRKEAQLLKCVAIKAEAPNVWAMNLITDAVASELLPASVRYDFHSRCMRQRTAIVNALTYIHTPLPLMYVHMITSLVKVTIFLWACYTGIMAAKAFNDTNKETHPSDMVTLIPLQVFVPIVYQSLLELHRKLQNPFLPDSMGFPEDALLDALARECRDVQLVTDGMRVKEVKEVAEEEVVETKGEEKEKGIHVMGSSSRDGKMRPSPLQVTMQEEA